MHGDVQRVMVIMAHPDDAEFTVAGTVARWVGEGREAIYLVCTNGNRGSNRPADTPQALAATRQAEQRAACAILGVGEVIFLGYDDGTLQPTLELRRDITRQLRCYRPEAVICSDPTVRYYGNNYLNHPDHRAAGDAALDAIFPSAGTRLIFPELLAEGLDPHSVREVFIHGSLSPDFWVDITETMDVKIAALRAHQSQVKDFAGLEEMLREWGRREAQGQGMTYAEAFKRVILK